MFKGPSSLSLDAKGRFSMPTRYRAALQKEGRERIELTITKHPHGCLMVFPRDAWEAFSEKIMALPPEGQWWKRIFLGNALDVEMDAAGRVLVAPELREGVGIDKEVMLIGMGSHFELWDKATHKAKEEEAMRAPPPESFKGLAF
ncbi:division/cell wall cluster transcriptional repressor MraZ [Pseudorhodoferax sp.]|uniref:division/cell wall cluster transcriptional repressor MraZ n=1 Tax=Pseudorhodoferax sp. TaxID=1993553 RepID=UPI0039E5792C